MAKVKVKPKPKQQQLPHMRDKKDPQIHKLAEEYAEARDARMRMGETEGQKYDLLEAAMKAKNLRVYQCGEVRCTFEATDKLKVKIGKDKPVQEEKP